jgi:hypothetical protein
VNHTDTLAVGAQARPQDHKDTKALLELRRWAEGISQMCTYAAHSGDPREHRAAVAMFLKDVPAIVRRVK